MNENIILRNIFGEYLEKLGAKAKNLVVLDSDLSNKLHTLYFAKAFPDRHFSMEMAESSLPGVAAGMTVRKKLPFICAEAPALLGKSLDMIRNCLISPNLNVKIVLSSIGLSRIEDGLAKTCTEDLALLGALPNIKIFTPADQFELRAMMDFMINDFGPTVLRIPRYCRENIFDSSYVFQPGQPVNVKKGDQICLISSGPILHECLKASTELEHKGLSTQVINLSSLRPLDGEKLAEYCRNCEMILTAEDHSLHGGIGSRVGEIMQHYGITKKLLKLGLDSLPECGKYQEVLGKYGLNAKAIYETVRENWLNN